MLNSLFLSFSVWFFFFFFGTVFLSPGVFMLDDMLKEEKKKMSLIATNLWGDDFTKG